MLTIPFVKLHGAENDFLLTWKQDAPVADLSSIASRICARTTGIGADGWMLVEASNGILHTRLFNSDGSEAEISGNGTRCAAAFALFTATLSGTTLTITTAAGEKSLRLISRADLKFEFEMNMGTPIVEHLHLPLALAGNTYDATILNVGNPQCAIFVETIPRSWQIPAAEAEAHPRFPKRSNVSFVRVLDSHSLEAVFYERGAGETRSSGTGSTGAATAAILRNLVQTPVTIATPAGPLSLRWDDSVYLTGPAQVVGKGSFLLDL